MTRSNVYARLSCELALVLVATQLTLGYYGLSRAPMPSSGSIYILIILSACIAGVVTGAIGVARGARFFGCAGMAVCIAIPFWPV
jgi:hypothetical protein